MENKNAGLWLGFFMLGVSTLFFVVAFQYEYQTSSGPGPGFLPRWINGFLMIASLFYLRDAFRAPTFFRDILPDRPKQIKNLVIFAYLLAYVLVINYIGFVVATTALLYLLTRNLWRWYVTLGIASGVSVALFWMFVTSLQLSLPVNMFGW